MSIFLAFIYGCAIIKVIRSPRGATPDTEKGTKIMGNWMRTANENEIEVNRVQKDYAWAICTCGNTVKFAEKNTVGMCPQCSTTWVCHGIMASKEEE